MKETVLYDSQWHPYAPPRDLAVRIMKHLEPIMKPKEIEEFWKNAHEIEEIVKVCFADQEKNFRDFYQYKHGVNP